MPKLRFRKLALPWKKHVASWRISKAPVLLEHVIPGDEYQAQLASLGEALYALVCQPKPAFAFTPPDQKLHLKHFKMEK